MLININMDQLSGVQETVSDPEVRLRLEGAFAKMAESLVNTDR